MNALVSIPFRFLAFVAFAVTVVAPVQASALDRAHTHARTTMEASDRLEVRKAILPALHSPLRAEQPKTSGGGGLPVRYSVVSAHIFASSEERRTIRAANDGGPVQSPCRANTARGPPHT